jgi:hypothetical protein
MKTPNELTNAINKAFNAITLEIMSRPAGQLLPLLTYASKVSPAACHKGIELTKQTTMQCTAGKSYENLQAVKDAIEAGERGAVEELKGKTWENFPFTCISDKSGERLIRLYPVASRKPSTKYFVNGKQVEKAEFASYLQPAAARDLMEGKKTPLLMFDKKESELIGLGELA